MLNKLLQPPQSIFPPVNPLVETDLFLLQWNNTIICQSLSDFGKCKKSIEKETAPEETSQN